MKATTTHAPRGAKHSRQLGGAAQRKLSARRDTLLLCLVDRQWPMRCLRFSGQFAYYQVVAQAGVTVGYPTQQPGRLQGAHPSMDRAASQ